MAVAGATTAALLLASCGSSPPPTSISLVPVSNRSSHAWHWTVQCPAGPVAGAACRGAGPVLGFAQLNGDEWNLGGIASAGSLDMSLSPQGKVTIVGRFATTPPCTAQTCLAPGAYTWVRGYPDVSYGISQCHAATSPPEAPDLPLPVRLDSIPPSLIGVTAYSASTSGVTFDISYDLWLHQTGTKQPCMSDGTLEIMVWTDYDEQALLPSSLQVGSASIPFAVGRVAHSGTHEWSIYASNIYRGGKTAPWGGTLWFVPDRAATVGRGRVSVDLSAVLLAARQLLRDSYGWPDPARHYWLDSAPFGVEFGPASGNPMDSGPSRFSVRISAFCLDVRSTLPDASCN